MMGVDRERVAGEIFDRQAVSINDPTIDSRAGRPFWLLIGSTPGLTRRAMGARVWRGMLRCHGDQRVERVSSSTSSRNGAVHDRYVRLGIQIRPPEMMFQYCPSGTIRGSG